MLKAGDRAPGFTLSDVGGRQVSLEQLLAEGTILLAFYKNSCPTCQFTMPWLNRVAPSESVRVYGVSQDDARATTEFVRNYQLQFPALIDDAASGYAASNAYQLTHVPTMFLVDQDARIVWASTGFNRSDL